jgi:YfiH family protein
MNPRDARVSTMPSLAERFAARGVDWIIPQWPVPASVHAFVTTRNGGVSAGPRGSLDLGNASGGGATPEETGAIAENRRRVAAFLPAAPHWLEQVHGADVRIVRARDAADAPPPRADAAVTRDADVVLGVRIADCMPVFLAAVDGSVVGVAHAGWRGLAAGVVERTVTAMGIAPSKLAAWLGPAIGKRAFEVGVDVFEALTHDDEPARLAFAPSQPGKWLADLEALTRIRLAHTGVTSVHGGGYCTRSDGARFYSYRRDRVTGRMGAFIWRTALGP